MNDKEKQKAADKKKAISETRKRLELEQDLYLTPKIILAVVDTFRSCNARIIGAKAKRNLTTEKSLEMTAKREAEREEKRKRL